MMRCAPITVTPEGVGGTMKVPIKLFPGHPVPSSVVGLVKLIVIEPDNIPLRQEAVNPCPAGIDPLRHSLYPVAVGAIGTDSTVTVLDAVDEQPAIVEPV